MSLVVFHVKLSIGGALGWTEEGSNDVAAMAKANPCHAKQSPVPVASQRAARRKHRGAGPWYYNNVGPCIHD